MIKYRTSNYRLEVTTKEIIRETEHMIVYLNSRGKEEKEMRSSSYHKYHDTYKEAVQYHVDNLTKTIQRLQESIDYNTSELVKAKLLFDAEPTRTTPG